MIEIDGKEVPDEIIRIAVEALGEQWTASLGGTRGWLMRRNAIAIAIMNERERIAVALEEQANMLPCLEDANVTRSNAMLIRANFSYEDAEKLSEIAASQD